jgi:hypothetical protein
MYVHVPTAIRRKVMANPDADFVRRGLILLRGGKRGSQFIGCGDTKYGRKYIPGC